MGRRLDLLNAFLRRIVRRRLEGTENATQARADFERFARFLPRPAYLLRLIAPGKPDLHWISVGQPGNVPLLLHFHGGGYVAGSPGTHEGMIGRLSALTGLRVVVPAYRLAPEFPAPAAFEDAVAAHAALLALGYRPQDIVLGGDSAGGGLALALLADLCRRGLRPKCVYAFSPWLDLTMSGDSMTFNADRDPFLPASRIAEVVGYTRGGLPPDDPRISPLFAGFDNPPPVQIHVGTTEVLLSDAQRMAAHLRAQGGEVELNQWEETPHAWPLFDGLVPEARETLASVGRFIGCS